MVSVMVTDPDEEEVGSARRRPRTRAVGYLAVCRTSFLYASGDTLNEEMVDIVSSREYEGE